MSHRAATLLATRFLPSRLHPTASTSRLLSTTPYLSASTPPSTPTKSKLPPRPEATLFADKAVPRQIHERPEERHPMPPGAVRVEKGVVGGDKDKEAIREMAFAGPSRPRMLYERPKEARELPKDKNRLPLYIALAALGASAWGLFVLHATNSERLSSSPLRQITFQLRNSPDVQEVLGDRVRYASNWWGFGEPWIAGTVNLMQGRVDLKFRIEGTRGAGTVYFTSIRPADSTEFQIVRYKVVADDGRVVLMNK